MFKSPLANHESANGPVFHRRTASASFQNKQDTFSPSSASCSTHPPPDQTKVTATNCTFATQTHTKKQQLHFIPVQTSLTPQRFSVRRNNCSWDKMPSLWWHHRELKKRFYCKQWLDKFLRLVQNTHTRTRTHTERETHRKVAVPATLGEYQGQRRIISVAQGRLSKQQHKHNHNSSKCRHFYSSGSWGTWAGGGGQRPCVFPGCHALLVSSRRSGVSCRLRWGSAADGGFSTLWAFSSNRSTPDRLFAFSEHIPQALRGLTSSPSSPEKTPSRNIKAEQERSSSLLLVASPACSPTHSSLQESANLLFLLALLLQYMTHSDQIKRLPKEMKPTLFYFINTRQFQFGSDDAAAVKGRKDLHILKVPDAQMVTSQIKLTQVGVSFLLKVVSINALWEAVIIDYEWSLLP